MAAKADTEVLGETPGKNEQIRKVFWSFFLAVAGLVLAEIVDPVTAEKNVAALPGIVPKGNYRQGATPLSVFPVGPLITADIYCSG